jgi:hypothetical protein
MSLLRLYILGAPPGNRGKAYMGIPGPILNIRRGQRKTRARQIQVKGNPRLSPDSTKSLICHLEWSEDMRNYTKINRSHLRASACIGSGEAL